MPEKSTAPSVWWPVHPAGQIGLCILVVLTAIAPSFHALPYGAMVFQFDPLSAIIGGGVVYLGFVGIRALYLKGTEPELKLGEVKSRELSTAQLVTGTLFTVAVFLFLVFLVSYIINVMA